MTDWDQLREVGHEVSPPSFDSLVTEAHERARRTRLFMLAAAVAVIGALSLSIATMRDDDRGIQPAQDPSDSGQTPDSVALPAGVLSLPESDGLGESPSLEEGRYRIALSNDLAFDVDLPTGAEANNFGLYVAYQEAVVKVETAGPTYGVPSDPCSGQRGITAAGETVGDLVSAIRRQPIYQVTAPEPVELGGAPGTYLELRIPAAFDASACDQGQVGLPGNPGTDNSMEPGYLGHWWIVDVGGQRVVAQTFCGQCDAQALSRVTTTVRSITFASR